MLKGGFLSKIFSLFLISGTLLATPHNEPWFNPLWEISGRLQYDFFKNSEIVAPDESFSHQRTDHIVALGLQTTPWPYWNGEIEIAFDLARPSIYEVTYLTGSYLWLDELACDLINLSFGLTGYFPNGNFLHDPSFLFVGKTNFEPFAAFGKELTESFRLWGYSGFGFAERGKPWVHLITATIYQPNDCFRADLGLEYYKGFGNQNITTITPFPGYANIDYSRLDIEGGLTYFFNCLGSVSLSADYNIYAQNSSRHNYSVLLTFSMPFSL